MSGSNSPAMEGLNTGAQDWFPFSLPASRIKRAIVVLCGSVLLALRPQTRRRFLAGDIDDFRSLTRSERWMLKAMGWQAERSGHLESLQPVHRRFWSSPEGALQHEHHKNRFRDEFLPRHAGIADWLKEAASARGIRHLVEFGCGRGEVLRHCVEHCGFEGAQGVDISEQLVEIARSQTTQPGITYACSDALQWLEASGRSRTAFLTNGGVLEYFSPDQLRTLFGTIAKKLGPALFALVEPIGPDHDVSTGTESRTYGTERSFSHPYAVLLVAEGFSILQQRQYAVETGQRWVMLVAAVEPVAAR